MRQTQLGIAWEEDASYPAWHTRQQSLLLRRARRCTLESPSARCLLNSNWEITALTVMLVDWIFKGHHRTCVKSCTHGQPALGRDWRNTYRVYNHPSTCMTCLMGHRYHFRTHLMFQACKTVQTQSSTWLTAQSVSFYSKHKQELMLRLCESDDLLVISWSSACSSLYILWKTNFFGVTDKETCNALCIFCILLRQQIVRQSRMPAK